MLVEETDEDDPVAALEPSELADAPARRRGAADDRPRRQGTGVSARVCCCAPARHRFPSGYKESLVEFPQQLRNRAASPKLIPRPCTIRKSAGCSTLP